MTYNSNSEKILKICTYSSLSLGLVSSISYMIYIIFSSSNISNSIFQIIFSILLSILSLCFIFIGLYINNNKVKLGIIICSIIISIFSIISIILDISTYKDLVLDFTGYDIKEVVSWADDRNILIEQVFENDESIEKYKVIKQNIKAGTLVSKIDKIVITVSDGIDTNASTVVDNMIGWNLDDVITFIDKNHLTNVTISFEYSDKVKKDIIISQDIINEIKRNEPITLVSSLGKKSDIKNVTMKNLVGLDVFHATIFLKRNSINYSLEYNYSEEKEEGTILKQNVKNWEIIDPNKDSVILTVSKTNEVTVTDLNKMNINDATTWATNNRLKLDVSYEFDDSIKKDMIISSSHKKGSIIGVDDTIKLVVSKGQLRMIKFTDIEEFKNWASENNVVYNIDYKYSNKIEKGNLISSSHKENDVIKNNDSVDLIISQGGNTTIPNLVGLNKTEAAKKCNNSNIICKFIYEDDNTSYDVVVSQSIKNEISVPVNTTIILTLGK